MNGLQTSANEEKKMKTDKKENTQKTRYCTEKTQASIERKPEYYLGDYLRL